MELWNNISEANYYDKSSLKTDHTWIPPRRRSIQLWNLSFGVILQRAKTGSDLDHSPDSIAGFLTALCNRSREYMSVPNWANASSWTTIKSTVCKCPLWGLVVRKKLDSWNNDIHCVLTWSSSTHIWKVIIAFSTFTISMRRSSWAFLPRPSALLTSYINDTVTYQVPWDYFQTIIEQPVSLPGVTDVKLDIL